MSIQYTCGIFVGVSYIDAIMKFSREDVDKLIDSGELDVSSPWYDSVREDWFIGKWYQETELDSAIDMTCFETDVEVLKEELNELMDGLEYKVYSLMNVF